MKIHPFHHLPNAGTKTFVLAPPQETTMLTMADWTSFKRSHTNDCVIALHPPGKPETLHVAALSAHISEPEWRQAERTQATKIEVWLRVCVHNLTDIPMTPMFPRRHKAYSQSTESLIKFSNILSFSKGRHEVLCCVCMHGYYSHCVLILIWRDTATKVQWPSRELTYSQNFSKQMHHPDFNSSVKSS